MAKTRKNGDESAWDIFEIKYQSPKFGTEGREFLPDIRTFTVMTDKGLEDAKEAFKEYYPSARIVVVLDQKSANMNEADDSIVKAALAKLEEKKHA